ncbi:MAG: hypothetical protein A2452_05720 [Candidatus Firestonebacteria bacterium RIFOXYC2_FULL_39_67]|nr:MAG: hypothetical protein A2536_11795 [Candidatus Firestonebacteria bacterium RIFOXYD2_FULL_39_29]OGF56573.1 MAG: hypothetical protein A2452_05720 [Candidatus Firestonebacteria bacterium RIFOXYC2_FULL_39_67]
MKRIILIVSVVFVSASMYAVDIYTRGPKKKEDALKSGIKETAVEKAPKYVVPIPDRTICPVTGVPIDVNDKTPTSSYQNKNYFFLNENAKAQFVRDPFSFAKSIETCDICGKQEKKTRDKSSFISYVHNGVTYHFDNVLHMDEFKTNPAKYIIGKENYGSRQIGKSKPKAKDTLSVKTKEAVTPEVKSVPPAADSGVDAPEKKDVPAPVDTKQPEAIPEIKSVAPAAEEIKKDAVAPEKKIIPPSLPDKKVEVIEEIISEEIVSEEEVVTSESKPVVAP